jgi:hypothetical protein
LKNIKPGFRSKTNNIPSTENATWASCIGLLSILPFVSSSPSKSRTDDSEREREKDEGKKVKKMQFSVKCMMTYNEKNSCRKRKSPYNRLHQLKCSPNLSITLFWHAMNLAGIHGK